MTKKIAGLVVLALVLSGCGRNGAGTPTPATYTPGITVNQEQKPPEKENGGNDTPSPTPAPTKEPSRTDAYDITIEIDPELRTVKGVEKLTYQNKSEEQMDTIYFNIYPNAFNRFAVSKPFFPQFENKIFRTGKDYGNMSVMNVSVNSQTAVFSVSGTVLSVTLPDPLYAGEIVDISMMFEAYVPKINHRTGANDYAMWFGNFFPIVAVYDTDGWHTERYYAAGDPFYSNMSNFSVKVTTPKDYVVVGTGEETVTESGDMKTTLIIGKMDRDFAFALGKNYKIATVKTQNGVYVNFYYYSDIENTGAILNAASQSLDYYSSIIGSYPYLSFSIVETGLFAEIGQEYPELCFMDSDYLKKPESVYSIAHEIGHQYFYNVVGSNQINEAWLDEGVVSYLQLGVFMDDYGIKAKMEADYDALKLRLEGYEYTALSDDISVYKSWNNYYNIQYVKASLMMYALNSKMGDETFWKFIKTYYTNNSFRKSNRERFIQTAEEVYGASLGEFFADWLDGKDLPPLS